MPGLFSMLLELCSALAMAGIVVRRCSLQNMSVCPAQLTQGVALSPESDHRHGYSTCLYQNPSAGLGAQAERQHKASRCVAKWADLGSLQEEDMLHLFRTNTLGPLMITQEVLREGLLRKGSVVANMTSKVPDVHTTQIL